MFALTQTMIVPLLPAIASSTGADQAQLSWLVTTPLVVAASLAPLLGRLADLRGKKTVLLIVLVAMTAGGLLVAVSPDPTVMILGRAMQGFGGAFVPIAVALLRDVVDTSVFVGGVALLSSSLGFGVALGVPIASMVAGFADWRVVFVIVALLTAGVLAGVVFLVNENGHARSTGRLDVIGGGALAILLAVLMVTIMGAAEWGLVDPRTMIGAGVVIVGGATWTYAELRIREPIVDLRVAMRPAVMLANAIAFFAGYALFANVFVTTRLIQNPAEAGWGFGLDVVEAGLFIAPAGVTMLIGSQVARIPLRRFGPKITIVIGAFVMAAGYAVHFIAPSLVGALIGLVVVSAGLSLPYAALPVLVTQAVDRTATGSANSINVLVRNIGQSVCSAVVGAFSVGLVVRVGDVEAMAPAAIAICFTIATAASIIAACLGMLLPRTRMA